MMVLRGCALTFGRLEWSVRQWCTVRSPGESSSVRVAGATCARSSGGSWSSVLRTRSSFKMLGRACQPQR